LPPRESGWISINTYDNWPQEKNGVTNADHGNQAANSGKIAIELIAITPSANPAVTYAKPPVQHKRNGDRCSPLTKSGAPNVKPGDQGNQFAKVLAASTPMNMLEKSTQWILAIDWNADNMHIAENVASSQSHLMPKKSC
jgi:hypothetical protein